MPEKNRRLIQGQDIIYPITKQENIIGLQSTIKEKLPIISTTTPLEGIVRQAWIQPIEDEENEGFTIDEEPVVLEFGSSQSRYLSFGNGTVTNTDLTFEEGDK